jgi:acyl carrier protein
MSVQRLEEELRILLAEASEMDTSKIGIEDDLVRELGLDSLAGLRLLAAVEKRFDVRFPDERLGEFRTIGQLLDFIVPEQEDEPS